MISKLKNKVNSSLVSDFDYKLLRGAILELAERLDKQDRFDTDKAVDQIEDAIDKAKSEIMHAAETYGNAEWKKKLHAILCDLVGIVRRVRG